MRICWHRNLNGRQQQVVRAGEKDARSVARRVLQRLEHGVRSPTLMASAGSRMKTLRALRMAAWSRRSPLRAPARPEIIFRSSLTSTKWSRDAAAARRRRHEVAVVAVVWFRHSMVSRDRQRRRAHGGGRWSVQHDGVMQLARAAPYRGAARRSWRHAKPRRLAFRLLSSVPFASMTGIAFGLRLREREIPFPTRRIKAQILRLNRSSSPPRPRARRRRSARRCRTAACDRDAASRWPSR